MTSLQIVQIEDSTANNVTYPSATTYANRSELDWFAYSAATRHMTFHRASLGNTKPITTEDPTVTGFNNTKVEICGIDEVHFTKKVI